MKRLFKLYIIVLALIICYLEAGGCTTINVGKQRPEYNGIDPKVRKMVNEYKELAKMRGIKFNKEVTVGFKNINNDSVVGLCNYGLYFREIDLDAGYWETATYLEKLALIWHEASHCYCGRDHDHDKGKLYEKTESSIKCPVNTVPAPGYYMDCCPTSVMSPIIVSESCFKDHYNDYVNEMFENCEPY